MKQVKICYSDKANLGDAINPYIVKSVLHYNPVLSDSYHCQITGIGSGLRRFFINPISLKSGMSLLYKRIKYDDPLILWSAGFINTPTGKEFPIRNMKVASVRGELSRQYVERLLKRDIDCSTGDGGLLCSKWVPCEKHKKYRLGIIPHISEKNENKYVEIQHSIGDSIIIDVEDEPEKNLRIISSCESIISSSLHGLIISDSYCVPNKHVVLTDKLVGDGFKFNDYYSSFGLVDNPIDLNNQTHIEISSIIDDYRITKSMVEKKQEQIIDAFHKFL